MGHHLASHTCKLCHNCLGQYWNLQMIMPILVGSPEKRPEPIRRTNHRCQRCHKSFATELLVHAFFGHCTLINETKPHYSVCGRAKSSSELQMRGHWEMNKQTIWPWSQAKSAKSAMNLHQKCFPAKSVSAFFDGSVYLLLATGTKQHRHRQSNIICVA